ncbi:MAG: hypothetical protein IKU34_10685 [Clostridia bacterium]|nr:hypothetical protein [Clostridia bacterium]
MKKTIGVLLMLLVLAVQAHAQQINTFAYGGTERDWLYQMAVSADGHIALTGWTESSDGTLSARTKTGRSGWLLVINAEGEEIVNFCTRLGNHDHLCYPVFREDGMLNVMLFAEDANVGWVKYELLCLDMDGKVLSRKVIAEKGADEEHFITVVGHDERGYILQERLYGDGGYTRYEIVDDDGNAMGELNGWHQLYVLAGAHVIHADAQDGKEMFLYSSGAGEETKLSKVFDLREDKLRPMMYNGFRSLPDGGAAGAGWVLKKEEAGTERIGLFTRWDAQGNLVSEMLTPGWSYGDLAICPDGFAATVYPWDENRANDAVWMLHLLDCNGVLKETVPLTSDAVGTGHDACVAALGDGTVVTAHVVPANGEDTVVTIIRP